jgi:hypothetical protein
LIRPPAERCAALAGLLPGATLEFLRDQGVPELLEFRLIDHVFTLDMQPLLDGAVFRLGTVDRGSYPMGLRRETGHFGYVFVGEKPPWAFCNSSIQCFLSCFAATERLWELVGDVRRVVVLLLTWPPFRLFAGMTVPLGGQAAEPCTFAGLESG